MIDTVVPSTPASPARVRAVRARRRVIYRYAPILVGACIGSTGGELARHRAVSVDLGETVCLARASDTGACIFDVRYHAPEALPPAAVYVAPAPGPCADSPMRSLHTTDDVGAGRDFILLNDCSWIQVSSSTTNIGASDLVIPVASSGVGVHTTAD